VRSWEDVVPLPRAISALARLHQPTHKVVMISNQSAIGRGLITLRQAEEINRRLVALLETAGARIDGVFMCPHHPDEACACRKPRPGLILQATEGLGLDLRRSILVGDAISDLQAGRSAGVATLALVRTGLGRDQEQHLAGTDFAAVKVFDDLSAALKELLPSAASDSSDGRRTEE
ncbi:MAG: HAD-IIIA family hydrolase, partial [Anaerolineales bacterium]